MARKGRSKLVDPRDLAPGIAAGLTQGVPKEEALRAHPLVGRPGVETVRHMTRDEPNAGSRSAPRPHFIAENAKTGFVRESEDRRLMDAKLLFTPELVRALKAGMICLKCLEPQETPFEDSHIPGCEGVLLHGPRYMKERQILDLAMEMEGDVHVGPSKPMQEMLDEQSVRVEKRQFIKRVLDGGQGKIPKAWLRDATLLDGLSDDDKLAIARSIG